MRSFCLAAILLVALPAAAEPLKVGIHPKTPLIEHTIFGDSLNFDILVRNDAAEPLSITQVDVEYLDADGGTLYSRRLDSNSTAIRSISPRAIDPKDDQLIYNPFPVVPPDVKPDAVRVKVTLSKPDAKGSSSSLPAASVVHEYSAHIADTKTPHLVFPLKGRVWVWDGHDLYGHHRRLDYSTPMLRELGFATNAERYSYDLVLVDRQNRMASREDGKNKSSFSFAAPVRATANGVVAAAEGSRPDDKTVSIEAVKANDLALFGNYVVIDHGNGAFSLFGHLHQGSVRVHVGDHVTAGQTIAAVGASGSSLFPHLHYQLQDGVKGAVEGLPSYFDGLTRVRGSQRMRVTGTSIDSGDIVEAN